MRKLIRSIAAATALAAVLALAPSQASAVGYEDSLDDCSYPGLFDTFVMRPIAFTGLIGGSLVFVGFAPLWLAFDARDAGKITHGLIVAPAKFTFGRRMGECSTTNNY